MNFVQKLEESLRDLAAEARKKHPGVKEASEKAVLKLRTLKQTYVAAVRQANDGDHPHPTTALFQSSDLLHPFLLAANYPNASSKLLEISFKAMRLLMEADAVVPSDGLHMVRVWMIQGQVVVTYYQRHYAKELALEKSEIAASSSQQQSSTVTPTSASTSSSSWFGWGSSSSASTSTPRPHETSASKPVSNAVSSSTGQTGQSSQSPKEMEKLALEILSCVLRLLELLGNYPRALTTELWSSAVALCCMWLTCVPTKHTVHQAARSTISQVLSLLYHPASQESADKNLANQTWEDLLVLAKGGYDAQKGPPLVGAFVQCRSASSLPSQELALELMTQLWRHRKSEVPYEPDKLMARTMSVTMGLLQRTKQMSVETCLRTFQWTLVVLQTQGRKYPLECRELFQYLLKPIQLATEVCRTHPDFEDGFVFTHDEAVASSNVAPDSSGVNGTAETHRRAGPTSTTHHSLLPVAIMWKASMALEAIYSMLEKDPAEILFLLEDSSTLAELAETLSDFATINASCQDHILQVVEFCESQRTTSETAEMESGLDLDVSDTMNAAVFHKAEQVVASGNAAAFSADESSKGAERKSSTTAPPPILGEALWIAFTGMLRIADILRESENSGELLEDTFAPMVAVMQHYLKRLPGSRYLVESTLTGYQHLADACLPVQDNSLQRKALLTSLCKLSLPSWGKHDASCQLQDHHVRSLLCLLRIVHVHAVRIGSGWQTILWTFEELSVLAVASPKLSGSAYQGALAISAAFGRFAAFSTCLPTASLMQMVEALTEISKATMENRAIVGDSDTLLPERAPLDSPEKTTGPSDGPESQASISGKIMNMGVRAIYGSGTTENELEDVPIAERTKNSYYEDSRQDFARRITACKGTIRLPTVGRMPFVLTLLADVAMANSFRVKECGEGVSDQLLLLASSSPAVRAFAMDTIATLVTHHLSKEKSFPAPFIGPGSLVFADPKPNQLLAVEKSDVAEKAQSLSQSEILRPLCSIIRSTTKADVGEAALGALNSILEGTGHHLDGDVWALIIEAVSSLSGDPSYEVDRSSPEWSKCCLLGFRCLKLIVNDFLDQLPPASDSTSTARARLLDCCSSFGSSRHDVNTSLTAIGLLWTIADQDAGAAAIDSALSKLVSLSSDDRLEVRNCAVNTLFSCIVGRGSSFTDEQWEMCLSKTVFCVYESVMSNSVAGEDSASEPTEETASKYMVAQHHSRDSVGKQWIATQVLVLQGLLRVLRSFFSRLLDTTDSNVRSGQVQGPDDIPWFQDAWVKIIDFAFDAARQGEGRDAVAIRSVGVELLTVCCQLTSKAGIHAATAPAKVGTNMAVVNGALRSVNTSLKPEKKVLRRSHSEATELSRQNLFLEAFESLESYQEFVENELKGQGTTGMPSADGRVQILQRFASGLSKVYDCCKDFEFSGDNAGRSLSALAENGLSTDEDDLECRFVKIVSTVLLSAGGDSKSRFLNQAQRAALDVLKSMAANGSSVAFVELLSLAGDAFFIRKESDADDSESTEFGVVEASPLIGFEAAEAVAQEISKESVSDECRLLVLVKIQSFFLSPENEYANFEQSRGHRRRRYYKRLIPILRESFGAMSRLESMLAESSEELDNGDLNAALDASWKDVCGSLALMLAPVPIGSDLLKMSRVQELTQIITIVVENVPYRFSSDVGSILALGAIKSFEVAQVHEAFSNSTTEESPELAERSHKHRDEVLKLFSFCFRKASLLNPDEPALRSMAKQCFRDAVKYEPGDEATSEDMSVEATLLVCEIIEQNDNMESLAISIFPLLCQLITSKNAKLCSAAGRVFDAVDVAGILETAQNRYEDAEKRAKDAEEKVAALTATVGALQKKNKSLQQEVLAAASSVL